MTRHLLIAPINLESVELPNEYRDWLKQWLQAREQEIEDGNIASSLCLQAFIIERLLNGTPQRDWQGVFDLYLTDEEGKPLAYSEKYGLRLFRFTDQWKQTPVHAVYTRYWIDRVYGKNESLIRLGNLIESFIQPDGWIYNPKVSETQLRTRMKSEYFMSMAMGAEILKEANKLENYKTTLKATVSEAPLTGYLSAEFFRLHALALTEGIDLKPIKLADIVDGCIAGSGYSDFAVKDKVDEYMGSAKRTSRDMALHSPLAGVHASFLSQYLSDEEKEKVQKQLNTFAKHLLAEPFDIPAFKIRDIPIPFGTDITPIEIICAAWIITNYQ